MIKRIIGWFLFIMLLLALVLYFNGITYVEFNGGYYNFLRGIAYEYTNYLWIRIPMLDMLQQTATDSTGILEVLMSIANGLLSFINFLSTICNFFLDLVFYIFALIKVLLGFSDYIKVFQ